ncbi:MAG TPA: hypothetical protein VGR22_12300 [Thermomicrobiales bacterium]|nr:hypothetical protein [Thermomicrobiales bacterium]
MTSLDRPGSMPSGELEAAFADQLERGAVDIVQDDDTGDLEVHADGWTLALQGTPPAVAFLAIDDEPAEEPELDSALDEVVSDEDLGAFRRLDADFNGALRAALEASGDPLSIALASRLALP